jgi:hypothetical protein
VCGCGLSQGRCNMGACDSMLCGFEHEWLVAPKALCTLHEKGKWDVLDGM